MLNSGISQEKPWSYIAQEHTKAAMANPQTVIPGIPPLPLVGLLARHWAMLNEPRRR